MKQPYLSRKEKIILEAIEIIDKDGLEGLTIREIAARQKISESAIYRHFKSKDELVLDIIEEYSSFDDQIINTVLQKECSTEEKIMLFANLHIEYFENYPVITGIAISGNSFLSYNHLTCEKIKEKYIKNKNLLTNMIQEGLVSGELKEIFTSDDLAQIIRGMVKEVIFEWRLNDYKFSLKKRIMNMLNDLLKLLKNK